MSKLIDIAGQRFGFWVAEYRVPNTTKGVVRWSCLCDCGTRKNITTNSLRSGNSTSCGCNHSPNLIGIRFSNLVVINQDKSKGKHSKRYWNCQCDCGNSVIASTHKLRSNLITSCGCSLFDKSNHLLNDDKQLKSRTARNIKKNVDLVKEQTIILASFNEEVSKSIKLLNELKAKIKEPINREV